MNRRIRKKKDKKITEAINGLVSIAERREQQRQAAIRQFVKRCEALYEQQRKERRNWRSNKEKDNLHDTRPYKNSYRPHWQLNTAARQTHRQRGETAEIRRAYDRGSLKTDRRFLCPFTGKPHLRQKGVLWNFSTAQSAYYRLWLSLLEQDLAFGALSISWRATEMIIRAQMLMCGKVTQKNLIDNSPLFRKKAKNLIEISKIFWYNKDMNYLILPCEILMNK